MHAENENNCFEVIRKVDNNCLSFIIIFTSYVYIYKYIDSQVVVLEEER